jgi:hypothetical protein
LTTLPFELLVIQDNDLPPDLRREWKCIVSDLTSGKMQYTTEIRNGELVQVPVGLIASTLRFMRTDKAKALPDESAT